MNEGIVIKDPDNNTYYTDDYDNGWSKDIKDARLYNEESLKELEDYIDRNEWQADMFEDITYELITVFQF